MCITWTIVRIWTYCLSELTNVQLFSLIQLYNYFFRYMLVRFEPTQPDIHMISKVTMVEQRWLKFNTSIWSSTKDPKKCPQPQTPTPHPPTIYTHSHPTVKASNNHSYRIDWMSIQGCSHLLKIVCNNCRSLLPLSFSTTPLLWISTKGGRASSHVWKCILWFENTQ